MTDRELPIAVEGYLVYCTFPFYNFANFTLVLKTREVTNPFPDFSNFPFKSEDVVFILSILSNFDEMSKVTLLSLPLISLCFLTLQRPHFSCSQTETNFPYLWTFPSRTSSEWSNHDKYTVMLQLLGTLCWYCDNCITKLWAHLSYFIYLYMVSFQHCFHSEQHCFHLGWTVFMFFEHSNWLSLVLNST